MFGSNYIYVLLFSIFVTVQSQDSRFRVIREWKYVNFTWPSEESYKTAVSSGIYIPDNNIIAGIKYFEDYYYITLPRMKNGVPATLTRIPAGNTKDTSPPLAPFPSWEMNNMKDCNSLHNVQNVEIDTKGQIWIIDGGRIDTLLPEPHTKCQPKLVVFDIKSNMTTLIYHFPEDVASLGGSFLYDIVLDDTDGGYAYITDNSGSDPGIIVYSIRDNRSWKFRHSQTMKADRSALTFNVNGINVNAPINIAGIALGPKVSTGHTNTIVTEDRQVFYSPLSSLHLFSINTSVLRNDQNGQGEYQGEVQDIGLKASQTIGMTMDNKGVLYFGLLAENAIAKWDSYTSFPSGQVAIGQDDKYIEWPNSFAFDRNGNLLVISNSLNRFIYERLNLDNDNFRILQAHLGAQSYLYDENFNYDIQQEGGHMMHGGPDQVNHMGHGGPDSSTETNQSKDSASAIIASSLCLMICLILGFLRSQ